MTLYPRRDVVLVAVSPSDGGCGASHVRTVTHGAPDPHWALSCPACERALIKDPQWAGTRAEVPETPDEVIEREGLEKRGSRDRETIMTAALAKLAGLADDVSASGIAVNTVTCRRGHRNSPVSRFCGECGISLAGNGSEDLHVVVPPTAAPEEKDVVIKRGKLLISPSNEELAKLPVSELREIAKRRGVDPAQPKKALVEALATA